MSTEKLLQENNYEFFEIAKHYGDSCKNCKEVCCSNMALEIRRDDIKRISKFLNITPVEFRKKYTILIRNLMRDGTIHHPKLQKVYDNNIRLLKFNECIDEFLGEEQSKRVKLFSGPETKITICPFFDIKTHRCKIHTVRPMSCITYPFDYDDDKMDFRKVNACVLSTNFIKRFHEFLVYSGIPSNLNKVIKGGEYYNHFLLPGNGVAFYLLMECHKLNIPIKSLELKEIEHEFNRYLTLKEMRKHTEKGGFIMLSDRGKIHIEKKIGDKNV